MFTCIPWDLRNIDTKNANNFSNLIADMGRSRVLGNWCHYNKVVNSPQLRVQGRRLDEESMGHLDQRSKGGC